MEIATPAILIGKHVTIPGGNAGARGWNRDCEQGASIYVAGLSPIKAWVRDQNFHSGHEQGEKGQHSKPVRDANQERVPRTNCFGHWRKCSNDACAVHGIFAPLGAAFRSAW